MTAPRTTRPRIPEREEYGSGDLARQLSWATAQRWLEEARYYWIGTTRPDGRPHAVPVWAVWHENRLYFSTNPETLTARNLSRRPQVVAHPESAAEAVIVHGRAERSNPRSLEAVIEAYESKYGWRLDPEDQGMPFFELVPRRVLAWRAEDVRGTSARWEF